MAIKEELRAGIVATPRQMGSRAAARGLRDAGEVPSGLRARRGSGQGGERDGAAGQRWDAQEIRLERRGQPQKVCGGSKRDASITPCAGHHKATGGMSAVCSPRRGRPGYCPGEPWEGRANGGGEQNGTEEANTQAEKR